jgi:hypothetical protein
MSQVIEHLPSKSKVLSSNSNTENGGVNIYLSLISASDMASGARETMLKHSLMGCLGCRSKYRICSSRYPKTWAQKYLYIYRRLKRGSAY